MELTEDEIERYRDIFDYFDHDKKGYIVAGDFAVALRVMNQNPTDHEIDDLLKMYDIDGDGKITFEEMVSIVMERLNTTNDDEDIKAAFRVFDKNGDGMLSRQELLSVLTTIGERLEVKDVDEILTRFDENNDDVIQYEEFAKMLLHGRGTLSRMSSGRRGTICSNRKDSRTSTDSVFDLNE